MNTVSEILLYAVNSAEFYTQVKGQILSERKVERVLASRLMSLAIIAVHMYWAEYGRCDVDAYECLEIAQGLYDYYLKNLGYKDCPNYREN